MAYQTRHVDSRYQAGATAVSDLELPMLAGYTANNDKPYCDGQPHTATDRAWAPTRPTCTGNWASHPGKAARPPRRLGQAPPPELA